MKISTILFALLVQTCLSAQDWTAKISDAVWEDLDQQEEIDFWVLMEEQATSDLVLEDWTKEEKAAFMYDWLIQNAERSQVEVLDVLTEKSAMYQSFWIVNGVQSSGGIDLIEQLARIDNVAKILPNRPIQHHQPLPPTLYKGGGQNAEWGIIDVGAHQVWGVGILGEGAVIGGQDTGYDWEHPALQSKYRGDASDHNYHWHDAIHDQHALHSDDNNPCGFDAQQPCDDGSHGTHTMGTMVGSDGENWVGVAPDAQWIGCRNMDRGWGTPTTYIECFEWFAAPTDLTGANPDPNMAPHVINNSWGCPAVEGCNPDNFETMRIAVANLRQSGVFVVASAGNDGDDCNSIRNPAAIFGESFTIGATSADDQLAGFSSRGDILADESGRLKPDVVAPGVNVRSCVPGDGYSAFSGTSMAGPHVAGVVALLVSADPTLAGKVDRIEEILIQSAIPMPVEQECGGISGDMVPNNSTGYGQVNVWKALSFVRPELVFDNEDLTSQALRVYPNPTSGQITIVTPEDMENAMVSIYTPLGELLWQNEYDFERIQDIDLSGMPKGIYFVSIENQDYCFTTKIYKESL